MRQLQIPARTPETAVFGPDEVFGRHTDPHTSHDAGVDNQQNLLGLYRGTPLTSRSVEQDTHLPDRITIYQRNIERMCGTRAEIIHEIRRTVFHEVGHHFGLDEDDLAELGYE